MSDLSQESPLWREWAESRHSVQQMRDELDGLRSKLDTMTAERNGLRISLNDARSDMAAALSLVADVRAAIGDDGKLMQPELIEYCKAMKRDAERYRWLRNDSGDDFETPWIALGMHGNEWLTGEHADAAIDAAMGGGK